MKSLIFSISLVSLSGVTWAETEFSCQLPMVGVLVASGNQQVLPQPALPVLLTQITQNGGSVSAVVSMITAVGPTQVAQNARSGLTLDLLACDEGLPVQEGQLGWADNPTQISLGNDWLQYHSGAVVGNWALMTGAVAVWTGVAYKMGPARAQFPGSLILPVLFLVCPTVSSAVTLLRNGDAGQQATGAISILLSLSGVGSVGMMMYPKFFKARWDVHEQEWVDLADLKNHWVARFGELFETYGSGRQGYIVVELLTSMAVGTLKSYQILEQNCGRLLWAGAVVYDAYAISQLALRPNKNRHVQMFYTGVACLQAVALTTQAIASVAASQETQEKVKTVTQSIVTATEYLMMVKTLFDMGLRFKSWYDRFYQPIVVPKAHLTPPSTPSQEMLTLPVLSVETSSTSSSSSIVELFPELLDLEPDTEFFGSMFDLEESELLVPRTLNEELEKVLTVFEESKTNHVEL